MPYSTVIFDLDGTLVRTQAAYRYEVVGRALADLGLRAGNRDIDRFWFEARRNDIIRDCFAVEPKTFWAQYDLHDTIEFRARFTDVYEDVRFLHDLGARGIRMAIVTGAPSHIARLETGLLAGCEFEQIIAIPEHPHLQAKPEPDSLLHCMREMDVTPDEAIYVGNSDEDILAAQSAGMTDVHLLRGEHDFPHVKPRHEIRSLHELAVILGWE